MRPFVAPLRRAAHLDRRHAARRGARRHRARSHGQEGHGRRRAGRRRHHDRHRRRAAQPPRRQGPRLHPRRLSAHGGPGPGTRRDHRPSSRSTSCSTSTCRASSCSARLSARRVCRDCGTNYVASRVREAAVDLRGVRRRRHAARRRHARGHQPPPRPLRGADRAADRVLPEPGPAGRRRRRRHARAVFRLLAAAVDATR